MKRKFVCKKLELRLDVELLEGETKLVLSAQDHVVQRVRSEGDREVVTPLERLHGVTGGFLTLQRHGGESFACELDLSLGSQRAYLKLLPSGKLEGSSFVETTDTAPEVVTQQAN